jgi:hypothetical protein
MSILQNDRGSHVSLKGTKFFFSGRPLFLLVLNKNAHNSWHLFLKKNHIEHIEITDYHTNNVFTCTLEQLCSICLHI